MKLFKIQDFIRYGITIGLLYFVFKEVPIVTACVIAGLSISGKCTDLKFRLLDKKECQDYITNLLNR